MAMRNFEASANKARMKYWQGVDVTGVEKGPDLINNEALTALNAAGTAEVSLLKLNASDVVEFPSLVSLPGSILLTNVARIATATGATTGTIAGGPSLQVVTVAVTTDANDIIILPAPVIGTIIVLLNGTTGYELRSSSPTTIGINGGTGTAAESAIPASTTAIMVCESLTNWKGLQMSSTAGTLAKVEVAAP